jgi:hypothetical protein
VFSLGWVLAAQSARAADGARLMPPLIQTDRSVRLELTNAALADYIIQASTNLFSWFTAASGRASNGLLVVQHASAANYPALFYRGLAATPPRALAPVLDTNQSALTLVTTNGGRCLLYAGDDTRIELIVPSMTLPDPTVITMTLVTNISGLPFGRGLLGAVDLEPAELRLWGAARLEITLPAGIDRRELLAYRFQTNGTRFAGMPSQILTNVIRIPVTELGCYGVSLASGPEAADFFNQPVTPATAFGPVNPRPAALLSVDDCQAQKKQVADAARKQIGDALDARGQVIASQLSALRRQQSLGYMADPSDVVSQGLRGGCQVYTNLIAPRWAEAEQNCALGQVLAQSTLGMERQRQLLGVSDDQACTSLEVLMDCALVQNCVQEVRDCCASVKGPSKVATVLGLVRQDQLLGAGCISDQLMQDALNECSSNAWVGTFTASEIGRSTTNHDSTTEDNEYRVEFTGSVLQSQEIDYGAAGKSISLVVVGNYSGRYYSSKVLARSDDCLNGKTSSMFSQTDSELVAATTSQYQISITLDNGGKYSIYAGHFDSPQMPYVLSRGYNLDYTHSIGCDGQLYLKNNRRSTDSIFYGPNLPPTQKTGPTNQLSGSLIMQNPSGLPPTTQSFQWNFQCVSGFSP